MSYDDGAARREFERNPDTLLSKWTALEVARLRDDLQECFGGNEMRLIAEFLISPFIRSGGKANILIENRLPRSRILTDELYLTEMLAVWIMKDRGACLRKMYEAMVEILGPQRAFDSRNMLGMQHASFQATSS